MAIEWEKLTSANNDVLTTARDLINLHHPDLHEANILFMFRSEPANSGGKVAYAGAEKTSSKTRALTDDADFIIWVSEHDWKSKNQAWREALIDHQLCHCCAVEDGGETTYSIRPHDIEEFHAVIQRHGAYTLDITGTDVAIEQAKQAQLMFTFDKLSEALEGISVATPPRRGRTYTVEVKSFEQAGK
jgi:hypothetical protein